MMRRWLILLLVPLACRDEEPPSAGETGEPQPPAHCSNHDPERNLYWGDLHVHTSYSFDAWLHDVRSDPDLAYRFAKGEPILLPPLSAAGEGTQALQLDRPLDFAAVTDHAEFLAEVSACTTPGSAAYDQQLCVDYREAIPSALPTFGLELGRPMPARFDEICGSGGVDCPALAGDVWSRIKEAAEDHYDRSSECTFTTFVGYEWSGMNFLSNLHRNVIFRSEQVPELPISYFDAPTPRELWEGLREQCIGNAGLEGCDVLAIPHNTNWSNGKMFNPAWPNALDRSTAELRAELEPLIEIFQHKGDAECDPAFSAAFGAPDELCAFEKMRPPGFEDCGDEVGQNGMIGLGCVSRFDFVRGILLEGLARRSPLGFNPFRLGLMASTDTHNGTPGAVRDDDYLGHVGTPEALPGARLTGEVPAGPRNNPGGLVAVWAEENTRDAIFEALRRRETYGTSGPRIAVRFFGGWELPPDLCEQSEMVATGYERGVPMGGILPERPEGADAPVFVVTAERDPGTGSAPGVGLQRLQIIKGWQDASGNPQIRVYDVAGGDNAATVDLPSCAPVGEGSDHLCATWTDNEHDPDLDAFYYVRVLQNPTCRWSTRDCAALPDGMRPEACDDPTLEKIVRERAWTSPIWYEP